MQSYITKTTHIQNVVRNYPEAAEIFLEYGLHCVGCHASSHETIEQGAKGHGLSDENISQLVSDMNARIDLIRNADPNQITLTPGAAKHIAAVMKEKDDGSVLRVALNDTNQYEFHIIKEPTQTDHTWTQHGVTIAVDDTSFSRMKGSTIDFSEHLGGFRIHNPQAS